MASWSELLEEMNAQSEPHWADKKLQGCLEAISKRRSNATVIFYACLGSPKVLEVQQGVSRKLALQEDATRSDR